MTKGDLFNQMADCSRMLSKEDLADIVEFMYRYLLVRQEKSQSPEIESAIAYLIMLVEARLPNEVTQDLHWS